MSPLFVCAECGAVDNTALGDYHYRRMKGQPGVCAECATGTWHGRFPKERYDPEKHDRYGRVRQKPEAA